MFLSGPKIQGPAQVWIPIWGWIFKFHQWSFTASERTQSLLQGEMANLTFFSHFRCWSSHVRLIYLLTQVEIEVPQTCSFIIRTSGCSLSEVADMDADGNAVFRPAVNSETFAAEMERYCTLGLRFGKKSGDTICTCVTIQMYDIYSRAPDCTRDNISTFLKECDFEKPLTEY